MFPTLLQNTIQRLRENVQDHKSYNDAFDAAANWLVVMDERVQDCSDTAGDWHIVQQRIEAIKVSTPRSNEEKNCLFKNYEKDR